VATKLNKSVDGLAESEKARGEEWRFTQSALCNHVAAQAKARAAIHDHERNNINVTFERDNAPTRNA